VVSPISATVDLRPVGLDEEHNQDDQDKHQEINVVV
jgi:hypothetical protein